MLNTLSQDTAPERQLTRRGALKLIAAALVSTQFPVIEAASMYERIGALLLKILSFDRSLKTDTKSPLIVGVVMDPDEAASAFMGNRMTAAIKRLGEEQNITVHGRRVTATPVLAYGSILPPLERGDVSALLIEPSMAGAVPEIGALARDMNLPTLCSHRDWVEEHLAIALVPGESPPKIVINLGIAKESGMLLDPRLLKLAEVI